MRRLTLTLGTSLLAVWGWIQHAASAAPSPQHDLAPIARSYGRWIAPKSWDPNSALARDAILHWAKVHHLSLHYDWGLDTAVHAILPQVSLSTKQTNLPFDAILQIAWTQGFTDAPLGIVAVRVAPTQGAIPLQKALAQHFAYTQVNRWAVAQDANVIVAAFAPHRLEMTPIASHASCNQHLRLAAQNIDPNIQRAAVVLGYPDGRITHLPLPITQRAFAMDLETGPKAGILEVQILLEDTFGPQVAAQFPIGVEVDAWPKHTEKKTDVYPTSATLKSHALSHSPTWRAQARDALRSLLWGLRQAHGLGKPQADPLLEYIAQAHAQDMQKHAFFGHISPTSGDVTQRLQQQHRAYARVVENLARSYSIDHAFTQWQHSPSHRANLLDPSVTHLGIGIAPSPTEPNDLLVVLVMARWPAPSEKT